MPIIRRPTGVTRRQFGTAAVAMTEAAAATVRPALTARSITLAGFDAWFQALFEPIVLASFRKAPAGIDVFYYPIGNSFQTLVLLRSERRFPSLDVVLLESSVATWATAEGLLLPLTPADRPMLQDLSPQAIVPRNAGPSMVWDSLALGYNPGQVATSPRSWRDLWNSAYGRIAVQTPPDPAALALIQVASTLFGGHGDRLGQHHRGARSDHRRVAPA